MAVYVAGAVAAAGAAVYFLKSRQKTPPKTLLTATYELSLRKNGGKPCGALGDESYADVEDFDYNHDLSQNAPVDLSHVLLTEKAQPYGIDLDRGCVVLVKASFPPSSSNDVETFIYQKQRKHATRVWLAPFQEFCSVVNTIMSKDDAGASVLKRVMFVHSTGRCGSTLLSKMLSVTSGVISLSEPDIYTVLAVFHELYPEKITDELVCSVSRCATYLHAVAESSSAIIAIKTRSQVAYIAGHMHKAMPESTSVFLYRNILDTVDSFCMAFFSSGVNRFARRISLDSYLIFKASALTPFVPAVAPLVKDAARFPPPLYQSLGSVGLTAMMWLSTMDTAVRLSKEGVYDAILRYEDLVVHCFALVNKLLVACKLPPSTVDERVANEVMASESHSSTARTASARRIAKSKVRMYLTEQEEEALLALLKAHGSMPDIIPGTLAP